MKKIFVVAAHPDDEVLGCGGTILKHKKNGDKIFVLFVSEGVSARYKNKNDPKCLKEIKERQAMAIKASKIAKFEIVDFMNLKNLELGSYPHTYISNKIIECFKKYKPDVVYTHYEYDLNIDHYHTFFSTFVACRPNNDYNIKKLLSFEVPSSTDWAIKDKNKIFCPNYFVDIKPFMKSKKKLLSCYKNEIKKTPHSRSLKNIESLSNYRGGIVGLENAEAFVVNKIVV